MPNWPESLNGKSVPYDQILDTLVKRVKAHADDFYECCLAIARNPNKAALDALIEETKSKEWMFRNFACQCIGDHEKGKEAKTVLIRLLDDPSQYVIRAACRALGKLSADDCEDKISYLLTHKEKLTRHAALEYFRDCWTGKWFAKILELFKNEKDKDVAYMAAYVLAHRSNNENWKSIQPILAESKNHHFRVWALDLVEKFETPINRDALLPFLTDTDGHVRKRAEKISKKEHLG
jgi:hypothetical protein